MKIKRHHILLLLLFLINLIPAFAAGLGYISKNDLIYIYWGEGALIGMSLLFAYMKHLIVFAGVLGVVALIAVLSGAIPPQGLTILAMFWAPYSLLWLGYMEMRRSRFWQRVRRLHPFEQLFYYFLFMVIAMGASFAIAVTLYGGWGYLRSVSVSMYAVFVLCAVAVPTMTIVLLRIINMIGAKHFLHFMIGTYHSPVERQRVVMFIDMVGSSKIAEVLSPQESIRLISRFIFDISAIIRMNGGDIQNFTGDGLVAIWPQKHASRALKALMALRPYLETRKEDYLENFGILPDFRIGVHAGTVMISQIGEEKLFLGLYGDVVNTAARLEQLNKTTKTRALISGAVVKELHSSLYPYIKPLGKTSIRGKEEKIEVFGVQI